MDILVNNAGMSWGADPEDMPLDKWQQGARHQPDGRVPVRAGGRPRDAASGSRAASSTSRRWRACRDLVNGPHYAAYAASKAGLMGLTRELAASWGREGHPRERDRARLLPLASRRCRDPAGGARASRRSTRFRASAPPGELKGVCRVPRRRRVELHHRPDDRRRRRTAQSRMNLAD